MPAVKNIKSFLKAFPFEFKLLLLWIIVLILINPIGEFPINDDWAYSQNVWFLSEEGRLHFSDWPGMTLIAQTLTGALFTSVFGFSFSILRLTTLGFGICFLIVFYSLLRRLNIQKGISSLTVLVVFFSPLFLSLSFTFMTEMYFFLFFYLSLLFYHSYLLKNKFILLMASSMIALIATLTRQTGIIIPIAIGITGLIRSGLKVRNIFISLLPFVIVAGGLWAYQLWLDVSGNVYGNYARTGDLLENLKHLHLESVLGKTGTILMYLGLFLLPISLRAMGSVSLPRSRGTWILLTGILALLTACIVFAYGRFPAPNVFYNLGLGPRLVKDVYWGDNISLMLSSTGWIIIKCFAIAGIYLLVLGLFTREFKLGEMIRGIQNDNRKATLFTILLMCSGYFVYIVLNRFFFDRYTLPLIILLAIIIASVIKSPAGKWLRVSAWVVLGIFMFFSVTAEHDFMEWNRARWEGLNGLMAEGVSERRIDGGLEFNAWYGAGPYNPTVKDEKSWWFVTEDEYVIASGPIEGFSHYKSINYQRWLLPKKDSVQILWHAIEGMIPYSAYPVICDCEALSENPLYLLSQKDSIRFEGGPLRSADHARSGQYSVKLDKNNPFAFLHRFKEARPGETFNIRIWRYGEEENVFIGTGGSGECLTEFSTNVIMTDDMGWDLMELEILIPDEKPCDRFGIYLWNNSGSEVWLDDLEINRIPPENTKSNVSTSISPGN
jgi:putative effector of murein hydrolase LrgA (UPF0299 family)